MPPSPPRRGPGGRTPPCRRTAAPGGSGPWRSLPCAYITPPRQILASTLIAVAIIARTCIESAHGFFARSAQAAGHLIGNHLDAPAVGNSHRPQRRAAAGRPRRVDGRRWSVL